MTYLDHHRAGWDRRSVLWRSSPLGLGKRTLEGLEAHWACRLNVGHGLVGKMEIGEKLTNKKRSSQRATEPHDPTKRIFPISHFQHPDENSISLAVANPLFHSRWNVVDKVRSSFFFFSCFFSAHRNSTSVFFFPLPIGTRVSPFSIVNSLQIPKSISCIT